MGFTRASRVLEERYLIIRSYCFECPYCGRQVPRGGKAEGFRKAGFAHHVYGCWEVGLYLRGYVVADGGFGRSQRVATLAYAEKHYHPRFMRSLKAQVRKRRKEGVLHLLEPKKET